MSAVDEIKTKLDIVTYIGQFVPLKKAGRYYKASCPFHSEKTPSFIVNPATQTWRCFGACAEGGDIFAFAQKQHGWTFPEAVLELGRQTGVEVRKQSPQSRQQSARLDRLRGLLQLAAETYHQWLLEGESEPARTALAYVKDQRGFSAATSQQFAIGYAPAGWQNILDALIPLGYAEPDIIDAGLAKKQEETGRAYDYFRHRLLLPIRDRRGRVVGFGARTLGDDEPKYLNSPQSPVFDKSHLLFGLDKVDRRAATIVIVEGYLDVIQAHQAGFTNVVAQMGTALTEPQLELLADAQTIILALDGDAAGQKATRRDIELLLRYRRDIRVVTMPPGHDPDDVIRADPNDWRARIAAAVPVTDYLIAIATADLPDNAPIAVREDIARRLMPLLSAAESDIIRLDNIQQLSLRLRIPETQLVALRQSRPPARQPIPTEAPWPEIEVYCLRALLQEDAGYEAVIRVFRELGVPIFAPGDFDQAELRYMFGVYLESLQQYDLSPADYVAEQIPPETFRRLMQPASTDLAVSVGGLIAQALRLRERRLRRETEELARLDNLDALRGCVQQRALVLRQLAYLFT